eukprot:SAG31_NODE_42801_length_270_cov_0.596491_1_plen_24_part_01
MGMPVEHGGLFSSFEAAHSAPRII